MLNTQTPTHTLPGHCPPDRRRQGALARAVTVALALAAGSFVWTGCRPGAEAPPKAASTDGHGGAHDPHSAPQDSHEGHDHDEAPAKDSPEGRDHGAAGHGAHAGEEAEDLAPAAIGAKTCEHDVRIVDCAECRYEVGVVKLGADVAKALVKTAPVAQAEVSRSLRLTGEVAFDATAMVEVVPMAAGTVTTVNVRLGQSVQTGEVLAVIHSNDVGEAKAAYLEVLTAAEIARQERDRQRLVSASLAKLLEALAKGPGNSAAAAEPLGEWRGRLVGAAARLDQARTVFGRESELVRKDASSKADLEAAQYEFRAAEADYAALVEEAQLGLQLEQLRADNAARQAEARLVAAEQRLHLFGFDQAAVDRVREMKENGRFADLEVRAPRAGTVTAVAVTAGHFVDAAQSLCTIADLSNLWVWCHLYERDLAALQEHLRQHGKADATVRVAAFVETFPGVVDLVGDEVEEATRTLKVRVQVPAPDGKLRPGMFATVGIELPTGRTATLVPRGAVLSDEGRAFVFQHWQDDLWLRRHVELGEAAGERVEVLRGLEPGAEVVVSGGFMLKSDVLREKMGAGCAD